MKNLDTSLACLEIASLSFGYRVSQTLTERNDVRILEAGPAGSRFLILASGGDTEIREATRRMRTIVDGTGADALIDVEVVSGVDMQVLEAFYSLPQVALEETLVVADCATVSGLLSVAQTLVRNHGLKPIELKVLRSSSGGGYGYFTGPSENCAPAAEDGRVHLRNSIRQGHIEIIDAPSETFRSFFNLSGQ